MPSFHPPLGHYSEVKVGGSSDSSRYALVTFSVTLDADSDGQYELWTDLPDVDSEGKLVRPAGEWHEIPFIAPTPQDDVEEPSSPNSATFTLTASSTSSTSDPTVHYARFHIPSAQATYSYTLRQVKQSGEIVWLGSGGNNGTVIVKHGEAEEDVTVESGPWQGVPDDLGEVDWTSIAISLPEDDDAPIITRLPHTETLPATLAIGLGIKPIDSLPFAQPRSSARPERVVRKVALAIAGSARSPLTLCPSAHLADGAESSAFGRSESGSLTEAINKALSEQPEASFEIAASSDSHVVLVPRRSDGLVTHHSIILAYNAVSSEIIELGIPSQVDPSTPVLCQSKSARHLLDSSAAKVGTVTVQIDKGLVAEVLRFTELSELRGAGSSDSVWICAPAARTVQIGEEEIPAPAQGILAPAMAEAHHEKQEVSAAGQPVPSATSASTISAASDDGATSIGDNGTEYEAEDEDDTASTIKPIIVKVERFWLFRMIDSIFYGLWSWLLRPFRSMLVPEHSQRKIADNTATHNTQEAAADGEALTPVHERTPLLSTPGLSRSPSSTNNSALASPESSITIRATRDLDSFVQSGKAQLVSATAALPSSETDVSDEDDTTTIHPIKIRSYTQFTFASTPPFTFFLPAQTQNWEEKLKFSYKPHTATKWMDDSRPVLRGDQGGAIEIAIGENQGSDDAMRGAWDVQVERV